MNLLDRIRLTIEPQGFLWPLDKVGSLTKDSGERSIVDVLPESEFALSLYDGARALRMLPMHTQESAEASAAVLVGYADQHPAGLVKAAAASLCDRLREFRVEVPKPLSDLCDLEVPPEDDLQKVAHVQVDDVAHLWDAVPAERFKADPVAEWAYDGGAGGTTVCVRTVDDMEKAAQYFQRYSQDMSPADQRRFGRGLRKAAEAFGIRPRAISAIARYGSMTPWKDGPEALMQKVSEDLRGQEGEAADLLRDLVSALAEERDSLDGETLEKAAHAIVEQQVIAFPNSTPLTVTNPFEFLFLPDERGIGKSAAGVEPVDDSASNPVIYEHGATRLRKRHFEEARGLNLKPLASILVNGDDVVEGLKSEDYLAVFESLPAPQKRIVANFVEQQVQFRGSVKATLGTDGIAYASGS